MYLARRLLRGLLSCNYHVGLEQHALERDTVVSERGEDRRERCAGHLLAGRNIVIAVHQYFGLDDRHQFRFLA